ncbi:sensor histidine kinase [Hathewaya proteolytica]|uniref:sensor histidine kinase n=1 Tax=Hathewaya proteolytica TaxID=29365 RepID=UPI0015BB00E9|nr:sensor histidine kinase [Hathewaya proteolytica]
MDIKSKDKISRVISNFLIMLLIFSVSIGVVYSGKFIKEDVAKRHVTNIFEEPKIVDYMKTATYSIYYNMHNGDGGNQKTPSEVFLDKTALQSQYDADYIKHASGIVDINIYGNDNFLSTSIMNLDYYAKDNEGTSIQKRGNEKLGELLKEKQDNNIIQQLNSEYQFYIALNYDENGAVSFGSIHGAKPEIVMDMMRVNDLNIIFMGYGSYVFPVNNTSVVYGVLKDLKYKDSITHYTDQLNGSLYANESMKYLIPALVFVLLCAIVIPYRYSERLKIFKLMRRVPIEILMVMLGLLMAAYALFVLVMCKKIDGSLFSVLNEIFLNANMARISEGIISIGFAFTLLLFTFLFVVLVKYIFQVGIKKYFKEHCLLFIVFSAVGRGIRKVGHTLSNVDLKDKNTKKLLTILGINLIIMIFISSIWFFGIFIAIIYTGFLYYIMEKKIKEIRKNYNTLLEATDSMGDGQLDIELEDDIGPFNSMRDELKNVQKGFKKAVDEEVKSQRMKTELISNVSHDLKTPLTSIITYVDLLKGNNISEEERKEYLDTVDKKSQRLKYLIEDLFEVTKASSGNMTLNVDNIDIVSLIKETLVELEDKIKEADLNIKMKFPEEKLILSLDGQRTFRVFDNLVSNICKYALHGSRVYIDVVDLDDIVQIEMKNISAEEMNFDAQEILERFQRGDKSRNTDGTGLGLAIAKSFVELQGGHFEIQIDGDLFKVTINFKK